MTTAIGTLIKTLRKKRDMSQRQLSYLSKISNTEISRIESGERPNPSVDVLKKLARPLGTTEEVLLDAAGYLPSNSILIKAKLGEKQILNLDDVLSNNDIEIYVNGKLLTPEKRKALKSILL